MYSAEVTAAIYAVAAVLFIVPLMLGAARTLARVIFYHRHKQARPRLLTRDVSVIGGLALFGLALVLVRALDLGSVVRDNVLWALGTSIPLVFAVNVYAYYELFVIERNR